MSHPVLIIGGTSGIGRALAERLLQQRTPVILAGRDAARAARVAREIQPAGTMHEPAASSGIAADLSKPETLLDALRTIPVLQHVVLAGMTRDRNSLADYDIARATELMTVKLIGYTAALHAVRSRLAPDGSVLIFGGISKDVPYPGSTTMTTVNTGVLGLASTLAVEMAPVRVNTIHPGAVEDSPFWAGNTKVLDEARARTLAGRLARTEDIVEGCLFLMKNPAANAVHLSLDGGRA